MLTNTQLVVLAVVLALAAAYYFVAGGKKKGGASSSSTSAVALKESEYQQFKLTSRTQISPNTVLFRFALPTATSRVGLPVGKHMLLRCHDAENKLVARSYTPVSSDDDLGYFDLLVKLYPTGKMSQHLQALQIGQSIEARGPQGSLEYKGAGEFKILRRRVAPETGTEHRIYHIKEVGMIAGGSGITPMLQLLRDVSKHGAADSTKLSLLFANVTEADILLRSELEELRESRSLTDVHYTLDRPAETWTGLKGFVTPDMIKAHLPAPGPATLILLCGPKPMVDMMEKHLLGMGYTDDMIFKY